MGMKQLIASHMREKTSRKSMLALRVYLGVFYMQTGGSKVFNNDFGMTWEPKMVAQIEAALPDVLLGYHWFLKNVVLDMPQVFAISVAWGELLLGLSLLTGMAVRLSGFLGAFMALNFALLSGRDLWLPHFDTTLMLALLALSMSRSGRAFGCDFYLARKFPKQSFIW